MTNEEAKQEAIKNLTQREMKVTDIIVKYEPLKTLTAIVYVFWLGGISMGITLYFMHTLTEWWQYVLFALYHIPMLWIKSISNFANKLI